MQLKKIENINNFLNKFNRFQAFSIHLGLSLFIFFLLVGIMLMAWYPPPLFSTDGGWQGIQIIAVVDLVLGPALTLLFFKPGKKSLWFDVSTIAIVQIIALSYGIQIVYKERPHSIVFAYDTFYTINPERIDKASKQLFAAGIDHKFPKYNILKGPQRYIVDLPKEQEKLALIIQQAELDTHPNINLRLDLYKPLEKDTIPTEHAVLNIEALIENDKYRNILNKFTEKQNGTLENFRFYIFLARKIDHLMLIAFDKRTNELAGYLEFQ